MTSGTYVGWAVELISGQQQREGNLTTTIRKGGRESAVGDILFGGKLDGTCDCGVEKD
jgi:hypothetical protein